jgi:hypothetical protein
LLIFRIITLTKQPAEERGSPRQAGATDAARGAYRRPPGVPPQPSTPEERLAVSIIEAVIMDWFGREPVTEGFATRTQANMAARESVTAMSRASGRDPGPWSRTT